MPADDVPGLPAALFTVVPVDLFRMGNASGPRLDNIRPEDVPIEIVGAGASAVRMVRPDGGISTFDGIDPRMADRKWWCIPASAVLPDSLRLKRDTRNPVNGLTHYSIRPARYMTLLEFADGLRILAAKATLVFLPPGAKHAASGR